jgi:hypothetical protein
MRVLIIVATVFALSTAALAQPDLDAFTAELRRAAQADDRNAVAAMIRYPLVVTIGDGLRVPIADSATFLARYDDIFTPEVRDAIARATGDVVIQPVDGQFRITSIVVPPNASAAIPPVATSAEAREAGVAGKRDARRIAIRVGPRPTQIAGTLVRGSIDTFMLFLPKAKVATVRLERVPAGAAIIRVVHARTGAPLSARVSTDGRFVSGRASEDADYRVEVRRIGGDDEHLPYMLSVTLR